MRSLTIPLPCIALIISLLFLVGCEKEIVIIERTVNAVWSSDDSEILKIVSTYETDTPEESYFNAISGENWKYRFELCSPELTECAIIGHSDDILQGGTLEYVPLYWLPKVEKICTINPGNQAVLKDMQGEEQVLELPEYISSVIFEATDGYYGTMDVAPSPDEAVIAVFFQAVYLTSGNIFDFTYDQCISFFDAESGDHIASGKVGFNKINPQLQISFGDYERRCHFLWSSCSPGVYVVTQDKAYFIAYGAEGGITEVDSVPERPTKTNSGKISNSGKYLQVSTNGNTTSLDIVQIDDWIPFDSLHLIPKESNNYSLY